MSAGGFWDDQDVARRVSTEHAQLTDDVALVDGLDTLVSDLETLVEAGT